MTDLPDVPWPGGAPSALPPIPEADPEPEALPEPPSLHVELAPIDVVPADPEILLLETPQLLSVERLEPAPAERAVLPWSTTAVIDGTHVDAILDPTSAHTALEPPLPGPVQARTLILGDITVHLTLGRPAPSQHLRVGRDVLATRIDVRS